MCGDTGSCSHRQMHLGCSADLDSEADGDQDALSCFPTLFFKPRAQSFAFSLAQVPAGGWTQILLLGLPRAVR